MNPWRIRVQRSPYSERSCSVALVTESGSTPVASSTGGSGGGPGCIGPTPISAAMIGCSGRAAGSGALAVPGFAGDQVTVGGPLGAVPLDAMLSVRIAATAPVAE